MSPDPARFRPLRATLALLGAVARVHPGLWDLRPPPYEYELKRRPLDLLLGDSLAVDRLRKEPWPANWKRAGRRGFPPGWSASSPI